MATCARKFSAVRCRMRQDLPAQAQSQVPRACEGELRSSFKSSKPDLGVPSRGGGLLLCGCFHWPCCAALAQESKRSYTPAGKCPLLHAAKQITPGLAINVGHDVGLSYVKPSIFFCLDTHSEPCKSTSMIMLTRTISIFGRTSVMSSGTLKIVHPILRATLIMYSELDCCSSSAVAAA